MVKASLSRVGQVSTTTAGAAEVVVLKVANGSTGGTIGGSSAVRGGEGCGVRKGALVLPFKRRRFSHTDGLLHFVVMVEGSGLC